MVNDDEVRKHRHTRRDLPRRFGDQAYEHAAAIFRAASDVARLKLLERLSSGEWCVSELADAAGANISTVSQQLRLLRSEGLVKRRREGTHVYYSHADAHVSDLIRNVLEHASEPYPTRNEVDDERQSPRQPRSRAR